MRATTEPRHPFSAVIPRSIQSLMGFLVSPSPTDNVCDVPYRRALGLGFFMMTVLLSSAIRVFITVTPHMSAILTNSIMAVILSFGVNLPKTTLPRYSHCSSSSKLRTETTSSISVMVVDFSSPSRKSPSNVVAKYGDCLQRSVFESLYSRLVDLMRYLEVTYKVAKSLNGVLRTLSSGLGLGILSGVYKEKAESRPLLSAMVLP